MSASAGRKLGRGSARAALIGTARVAESHRVREQHWELRATLRGPFSLEFPVREKRRCSVFIFPFSHFAGGNQNIYRQKAGDKKGTAKKAVECALKV